LAERLQDSFFRALFHSPVVGIAVVDLDRLIVIDANDLMLEILGRARDELLNIPEIWKDIVLPEYAEPNARALEQALERGYSDPLIKHYVRPSGERVPVRTIFGRVPDYPERLVVFASDVTEEWQQRQQAAERETRFNVAISAAQQGVWDYNVETGEMIYSERAKEIYGLPLDQPVTFEQIRDATHPDDLPNTHALLLRAIDPAVRDRSSYEYRIVRPDGTICWALAYGEAVFVGPPGQERAVRYIGTLQDITDRKLAERRQQMLVAELNHRVKNTLAVVQSFAHQSFTQDRAPEAARASFEARLSALASTHDLLTGEGWDVIAIADLIRSSLAAHDDGGARVEVDGPNVRLIPKTAVTMAMTLHELATNSTKYGALSQPQGTVQLRWTYEDGVFRLRWVESGGPPCAPPQKFGFGTRMLQRALATELGGRATLDYPHSGFTFAIEAAVAEPI
jgi:PAS domain S-box-containing protein